MAPRRPTRAAVAAPAGGFEKIASFKGADLVGKQYTPLFEYYRSEYGATAWRVVADEYVTDDAGTGIVHQAPAFGEDDYRVCIANGVLARGAGVPCPVDAAGRFTDPVTDFKGQYVKEADKAIVAALKAAGRLVDNSTLTHSYPFCWRSETPLLYKVRPRPSLRRHAWWYVVVGPRSRPVTPAPWP